MEYKTREDGTAGVPSSLFGFRRFRSCSPWFISGRENCREKPPPEITTVFSRNHPSRREALPCSAPPGVLPAYPLTFLWGKLPAARDLRFRSKLKLHFQNQISTHKNSTCEKNRQLRNNFWEVTATSNHQVTTFRAKATTLLQNEAKTRPKPFLWHKKIFML